MACIITAARIIRKAVPARASKRVPAPTPNPDPNTRATLQTKSPAAQAGLSYPASLQSAHRMMPDVSIGVPAQVAMTPVNRPSLDRIGGIGRLDAEQPPDTANDTTDRAADHGADWPRGLSALLRALRYAAWNTLRLRRQRAAQRGNYRACKYDVKLHATTPLFRAWDARDVAGNRGICGAIAWR